ncbi:MAG: DUF4329 domain-containing protein, partial [Pseudomonadales bacterium]|nr:DUF4329 domain-containing protein [Pseudomonadales bacterium]
CACYLPRRLTAGVKSTLVTLGSVLLGAALASAEPTQPAPDSGHSCARQDHPLGFHGHFASVEQAAAAAADRFNPYSIREDREYMGAILRHKHPASGKEEPAFTYTAAAGHAHHDRITIKVKLPGDYEIVAFWHTHGAEHWSRKYFSDTDTRLAKHWGVPFYLADFSGLLRVYKPDSRILSLNQARRLGLGSRRGFAKGQVVTHPQTGKAIKVSTRISRDRDTLMAMAPGATGQCPQPSSFAV